MEKRLNILTEGARFDLSCACGPGTNRTKESPYRWIYPAALPSGKSVFLFKVLLTDACSRDCIYCINRRSNKRPRYSFTPEELVRVFLDLKNRGLVSGLFLTSAIPDTAPKTMERMLKAVEFLRLRHKYRGYIHLKILPGVPFDLVERAVSLATRVSINVECPTSETLARVAGEKDLLSQILRPIAWVKNLQDKIETPSCDQTTQFVVGAAGETDRQILGRTWQLYREANLSRVYFSAFQPPSGRLWEGMTGVPLIREHRLYQADFLFRKYGFKFEELLFAPENNLTLESDPKQTWADANPARFPVEINKAEKSDLLRVPGIGPVSALRILKEREEGRIHRLEDLKKMGVIVGRARPYILLNGKAFMDEQAGFQLLLWAS
ncbi:MAG: radical SAM protein [Chloroflexi bacterium]|nr:radical SAM protein [Chloroflexota bacterium]